jgi:hypothetical protein
MLSYCTLKKVVHTVTAVVVVIEPKGHRTSHLIPRIESQAVLGNKQSHAIEP